MFNPNEFSLAVDKAWRVGWFTMRADADKKSPHRKKRDQSEQAKARRKEYMRAYRERKGLA